MIRRILTSAAFVTLALGLPVQAQDRSCAPQDWAALKGWNQVWAAVGPDAAAQGLSGRGGPSDFKILGPPLSEQARFVERIRLVSPGQLEDRMTITDPLYLTEPWTVTLQFVPAGLERLVLDAYDDRNDTEGGTITRSTREEFKPAQLPAGVELSEAQLDAVAGV